LQTLAIIGAGFSGTMVAVHLLRLGSQGEPTSIVLIERTGRFTAGVAYGTTCSSHLLNVPAGRMSAFEGDADHFLRWARSRDPKISGGTFVPRRLYGQYLADVLDEAESSAHPAVRLMRVPGEARAITSTADRRLTIDLGGGGLIRADRVVLAIGNFPPADPPIDDPRSYDNSWYFRDPWAPDAVNVAADQPVLLIGTGLTMLDIALALRDRGHRGTIHAISRRGLLPQPHRHSATPPPQHERPAELDRWPRTARGLLEAIRHEVQSAASQGVDWREVITSLRADTPALWRSLPQRERERFLRHLRPFWETHRHRAAPTIASDIQTMIDEGRLRVMAGRVAAYRSGDENLEIRIRRRGADDHETLRVGRVINCTGPDTDLAQVREPLIQSMRRAGLIRTDPLGLGLDSDARGAIISVAGRPCDRLFLVGPLRKGQLWENTAVPELRIEAQRMAELLSNRSRTLPEVEIAIGAHSFQC
jgi:uncharacterized NAD(P)/FAD-binding protein YdhS